MEKIFSLRKTPVILSREDAIRFASRGPGDIDLTEHWDVCIRQAANMFPLNLTGKSVIDIGCGPGAWTHFFTKRGAAMFMGIDNCSTMIQIAAERNVGLKNVFFKHLALEKMVMLNKKFNYAIASYALNNITSLSIFFQACNRVLTKNGKLIIATKIFEAPEQKIEKFKGFFLPIKIAGKFTMYTSFFTIEDYKNESEEENFTLVDYFLQTSRSKFSNSNLNKANITIKNFVAKYQKL